MKKCPFCAEDIKKEAIKCKHCNEWIGVKQLRKGVLAKLIHGYSELKPISNKQESEDKAQCPQCKKWDVKKLYLQDSSYGYYCYNCNQSLKAMPSFIDGRSTPSTAKTIAAFLHDKYSHSA